MDGFEATPLMRNPGSQVRDHQVPIIAMAAHAMQSDRERCLEAGMNDYVPKPVRASTLLKALETRLRRQDLKVRSPPEQPDGTRTEFFVQSLERPATALRP